MKSGIRTDFAHLGAGLVFDQFVRELRWWVETRPASASTQTQVGLPARAAGESIFTQAESIEDLHQEVRDAVKCHFEADKAPKLIRLHFVRDEVITAA